MIAIRAAMRLRCPGALSGSPPWITTVDMQLVNCVSYGVITEVVESVFVKILIDHDWRVEVRSRLDEVVVPNCGSNYSLSASYFASNELTL